MIFVDTGVLYAQRDMDAPRHEAAHQGLKPVLRGRFGTPVISDYVVDEAYTLTLFRTGRADLARGVLAWLTGADGGPDPFRLIWVGPEGFQRAAEVLDQYHDHDLSFTDATTVASMEASRIQRILSFDDDFDGIVDRLDPATVADQYGA